jgi:hypothetical protein
MEIINFRAAVRARIVMVQPFGNAVRTERMRTTSQSERVLGRLDAYRAFQSRIVMNPVPRFMVRAEPGYGILHFVIIAPFSSFSKRTALVNIHYY